MCRRAHVLNVNDTVLLTNLASMTGAAARDKETRYLIQRAMQLEPNNVRAMINLAGNYEVRTGLCLPT